MIQIQHKTNSVSNDRIVGIKMLLDCPVEYESIEISIKKNDVPIPVVSSSEGYILGHRVIVDKKIKFVILYISNDICDNASCIIEYLNYGQMVHYDYDTIYLYNKNDYNPEIRTDKISINSISLRSSNKVKIHILEDIIIRNMYPSDSFVASFGDMSDSISKADIIFNIYKNTENIIIPKEIIWINYNNYVGSKLRCCELIKSTSHSVKILHKVEISDAINLSDIPSKKLSKLSDFKTPTKQMFKTDEWELSDLSSLPIHKANNEKH